MESYLQKSWFQKKNQLVFTGDRSAWHGPSSHSERPVESEVRHTGPTPTDVFLWGIRPALYLGHFETCFLLKLPHPELRQQMFTAYL